MTPKQCLLEKLHRSAERTYLATRLQTIKRKSKRFTGNTHESIWTFQHRLKPKLPVRQNSIWIRVALRLYENCEVIWGLHPISNENSINTDNYTTIRKEKKSTSISGMDHCCKDPKEGVKSMRKPNQIEMRDPYHASYHRETIATKHGHSNTLVLGSTQPRHQGDIPPILGQCHRWYSGTISFGATTLPLSKPLP